MVKEQLDSLNSSKSLGPDEIHPKLLLELRGFLAHIRTKIYNKSWDEKRLPEDWKLAHIASIFKKGKKLFVNNYRPVSLTSIVCKTLEKKNKAHLMEHLEKK